MKPQSIHAREAGLSLIEMMVTLVIGALLIIGVVAMFSQTRSTYRTNDTVARMQENARFILSQMEPDLRMTGSWGMQNSGPNVEVPAGITVTCPDGSDISAWLLNNLEPVTASNSAYTLPCTPPATAPYLAGTDVLVVRHASGAPTVLAAGVVQIQSDRSASRVFNDGTGPGGCCTFNWQTNAYYISSASSLGANVPALRRKTLVGSIWQDEELVAGVENLQVQLGVDTDADGVVDRYVDPDNALVNPLAFPARIIAVQLWLMMRADATDGSFSDAETYNFADVAGYAPADQFRRQLVSKTIMLRNMRN
ncbi:MAG: PilW family protein [Gammaproteobacteria bacterium]|nr:PilW family protein [Gammaproteobacteria bacterium]